MWIPTAAIVVEVVSPDDESWAKFDFYGAHGVDEVVIADPGTSELHWFVRNGDGSGYETTDHSPLLEVTVADIHAAVDWPARHSTD